MQLHTFVFVLLLTAMTLTAPAAIAAERYAGRMQHSDQLPIAGQLPFDEYREELRNGDPFYGFAPRIGAVLNDGSELARYATDVPKLTAHGVELFRVGVGWWRVESAQGRWDFSQTKQMIDAVVNNGGEVLALLGGSTPWTARVSTDCFGESIAGIAPPSPDKYGLWAAYIDSVVANHGDLVDYYEIWNEPDLDGFFYGTVAEYRELLAIADSVLSLRDPSAKIVLGGLAFPLYYGSSWFEEFLDAESVEWFDIIGVHAYSAMQHHVLDAVTSVWASEFPGGSEPLKDIWVTETGHPGATLPYGDFSRQRGHEFSQVDYVHRTLSRWRHPKLKAVFWFNGWDSGLSGQPRDDFTMGLLDSLGIARPALRELGSWVDPLSDGMPSASYDASSKRGYQGIYPVETAQSMGGAPIWPESNPPSWAPRVAYQDGMNSVWTRRFDPAHGSSADAAVAFGSGLHFDVDDEWMFAYRDTVAVEIEYYGQGDDVFYLQYDHHSAVSAKRTKYGLEPGVCAVDPALPTASPFSRPVVEGEGTLGLLALGGSSLWRVRFVVPDPYFANRLATGTDLRVRFAPKDMDTAVSPIHIRSITVRKAPQEEILHPTESTLVFAGDPLTISWGNSYAAYIHSVDLVLHWDGMSSSDTLVTDLPNTGSFTWTPAWSQTLSDAVVEVIYHNHWSGLTASVVSAPFAILQAPSAGFANESLVDAEKSLE